MKTQMETLKEGTCLGYEGLKSGRVAIRFYRSKWGNLSEYIDTNDFPESYKPVLREILTHETVSDVEKAEEIKSLLYRYPFKLNGEVKCFNERECLK